MADRPESGQRLAGRVALITGAGSGIGEAIARRFLAEGARVGGFDRAPFPASALIEVDPGSYLPIQGDVTSAEDLREAVDQIGSIWSGLDVLIVNAGIHDGSTALAEYDPSALERTTSSSWVVVSMTCR